MAFFENLAEFIECETVKEAARTCENNYPCKIVGVATVRDSSTIYFLINFKKDIPSNVIIESRQRGTTWGLTNIDKDSHGWRDSFKILNTIEQISYDCHEYIMLGESWLGTANSTLLPKGL